jgi:hypothetical protein
LMACVKNRAASGLSIYFSLDLLFVATAYFNHEKSSVVFLSSSR